jgi:hypothetical protein
MVRKMLIFLTDYPNPNPENMYHGALTFRVEDKLLCRTAQYQSRQDI